MSTFEKHHNEPLTPRAAVPRPNLRLPTLGGRQLWADELFFHGWHIQRNVLSGHYRLLDAGNWRYAWGTFDDCRRMLERIRSSARLPAMSGPGVILLHGLTRSAAHMAPLGRYLRAHGHENVFSVTYPTTRGTIDEHAEQLARVIQNLEGIGQLSVVGHSLGCLVMPPLPGNRDRRAALADRPDRHAGPAEPGRQNGRDVGPPPLVWPGLGQGSHAARPRSSRWPIGWPLRPVSSASSPAAAVGRAATTRCLLATTTFSSTSPAPGCREPPISSSCRSRMPS